MKIKNTDFTIISNNCWGGYVYQMLGIEYKTPFVGLFLYANDYYKVVSNLKYYMNHELQFKDKLIYFGPGDYYYPVGLLKDVEIHFLHYKSKDEALEKWNRRKQRINYNNVYFKFDNRDGATEELLQKIDKLSFRNKIIFVNKPDSKLCSSIYVPGQEESDSIFLTPNISDYFDVETWLNKGGNTIL